MTQTTIERHVLDVSPPTHLGISASDVFRDTERREIRESLPFMSMNLSSLPVMFWLGFFALTMPLAYTDPLRELRLSQQSVVISPWQRRERRRISLHEARELALRALYEAERERLVAAEEEASRWIYLENLE